MKTKIILAALILICTIGIAVADDDVNLNLKAPDSFSITDDGSFQSADGLLIDIERLTTEDMYDNDVDDDTDADDGFDAEDSGLMNNTTLKYIIVPGKTNNTFNFTDGITNTVGCIELVEIEGQKYIVSVWNQAGDNATIIQKASDALEKFNELNNLTPLDTTEIIK